MIHGISDDSEIPCFYNQIQINSAITAGFDGKMAKNGIDIHLI